jgi:hypothetical protein
MLAGRDGSSLVSRPGSLVSIEGGEAPVPARREEEEYPEYLTDEQRRAPATRTLRGWVERRGTGCIAGRMQQHFWDATLALRRMALDNRDNHPDGLHRFDLFHRQLKAEGLFQAQNDLQML